MPVNMPLLTPNALVDFEAVDAKRTRVDCAPAAMGVGDGV